MYISFWYSINDCMDSKNNANTQNTNKKKNSFIWKMHLCHDDGENEIDIIITIAFSSIYPSIKWKTKAKETREMKHFINSAHANSQRLQFKVLRVCSQFKWMYMKLWKSKNTNWHTVHIYRNHEKRHAYKRWSNI